MGISDKQKGEIRNLREGRKRKLMSNGWKQRDNEKINELGIKGC
jgi:hypothetical protein